MEDIEEQIRGKNAARLKEGGKERRGQKKKKKGGRRRRTARKEMRTRMSSLTV